MIAEIQTFHFSTDLSIQAIVRDGQPWFNASEICAALDHSNTSKAVTDHVDPEDKSNDSLGLPGSARLMVNESGLYCLILRSKKPEARTFQKWVTSTVLPSLRKDGLYIAGQEKPITDDLTLPELHAQIAAIQAKVDAINAARLLAFSRHQEEKDARADALRMMRGGRRYRSRAPKKPGLTTKRITG